MKNENRKQDELTDIWALGVTFFKILTGRHPFEEEKAEYLL